MDHTGPRSVSCGAGKSCDEVRPGARPCPRLAPPLAPCARSPPPHPRLSPPLPLQSGSKPNLHEVRLQPPSPPLPCAALLPLAPLRQRASRARPSDHSPAHASSPPAPPLRAPCAWSRRLRAALARRCVASQTPSLSPALRPAPRPLTPRPARAPLSPPPRPGQDLLSPSMLLSRDGPARQGLEPDLH